MDKEKPLMSQTAVSEVVEDANKQITTTKKGIFRFLERGVYIVAVIAMAVVLMMGYGDHKIKMKTATDKYERLNKTNDDQASLLKELTDKNRVLEDKLAHLKNKEDVARRDLEAYITNKYKVIPKVVAKEVSSQVVLLTKEKGVPFSLIVGLIEVESQFKPWAISKKDARGLMQVMPFWVKKKKEIQMELESKYDLHDIATNVKAGIQVFKYHLKEANNDINQGLYLYVGKDRTYANKVFNAMGRFEVFRSTLDTTLRAEEDQEVGEDAEAVKVSTQKVK